MPHLCPRPCSRLTTAAVFISVGVVQFVAGILLLQSRFVYLLAGPDFWTSACNIAVGCLLGLSASIWKSSKKRRPSKKHFIRRNLLLTLLFSALIMNMTTLGIFLLGEGNTLLSIRLENGKKYEKTNFAIEVLAYAYVTSVCCPIICIVVTIVSMSGSCFKYATVRKNSLEAKTIVNTISNGRMEPLRWIYTPEFFDLSKMRELDLSSSSESLSEEDEKDFSTYRNCSNSAEEIHDVLSRMAHGKRDSMLTDSAVMLREMDLRRKNKYDTFDRDGSYVGPMLQRARESILGEGRPEEQPRRCAEFEQTRVKKHKKNYSGSNRNSLPPENIAMKRMRYAKGSRTFGTLYKNPYASEELMNEYHRASSKLAKHYPSHYKKFREKIRSASDVNEREAREFAGIHKKPRLSDVDLELRNFPSEYRDKRKWKSAERMQEESKSFDETSPKYLSPDGSDFGGDSIFEMSRRSSWAGEVVPISVKRVPGLKLSHKLIPVSIPVVPPLPRMHDAPRISDDSGIGSMESNPISEAANCDYKNTKSLSSFQEDLAVRNKDDAQEYPKMGSQSTKKYDTKVVKMASISEEPNLDVNNRFEDSLEGFDSQDDADLASWKSYRGKKSPLSKNRDRLHLRRDSTLKRKASVPGNALRRIWSLAMPESKYDFRDQVVDEDSLIGLSEEELIARHLRTRSIRKVVQQRMRENVGM